jgi:hypothetical protein
MRNAERKKDDRGQKRLNAEGGIFRLRICDFGFRIEQRWTEGRVLRVFRFGIVDFGFRIEINQKFCD